MRYQQFFHAVRYFLPKNYSQWLACQLTKCVPLICTFSFYTFPLQKFVMSFRICWSKQTNKPLISSRNLESLFDVAEVFIIVYFALFHLGKIYFLAVLCCIVYVYVLLYCSLLVWLRGLIVHVFNIYGCLLFRFVSPLFHSTSSEVRKNESKL